MDSINKSGVWVIQYWSWKHSFKSCCKLYNTLLRLSARVVCIAYLSRHKMCKSKTLETWNTHTGQSRDKGGQKTGINLEVDIFMLGGREKVRRRDFGRKWRKLEKTNVGNGLGDIQVAGMAGFSVAGKNIGDT